MAKPTVIVVGADKGGVGKTTVARTVLDYFTAHHVPTRAFDTESPKGTLKRFHPDISDIVDVTSVPDQMRIFDTLSTTDASVTVIDVRAGLLSPTLRSLRDIGFLDAVKKGQLTFAVFHILGSSIASLNEIEDTASFAADGKYFLVKNFINNTSFFEWDQPTYSSYFKKLKDAVEITIPKLNEMAYEQVELASVPFLTFVANKGPKGEAANYSFVLRGYVRHWLGNVWGEYDRIKLNEIVASGGAAPAPGSARTGRQPVVNRAASLLPRPSAAVWIIFSRPLAVMRQPTPLFIVASPRPRVGKTLIARLLLEFFRQSRRPLVGYDLNPRDPALTDRFPRLVWPIDIAETRGQMELFDRLLADNAGVKIIDLGYGPFDQFFAVMRQIGFVQEARRRLIEPIVLFVTDPALATVRSYAELRRRAGGDLCARA